MLTCLNKRAIHILELVQTRYERCEWHVELEEVTMGRYADDAKELLRLVGGKENIAAVSHCITRMRFVLNDPGKADIQGIESLKSVKGSFTQSGQFQVII